MNPRTILAMVIAVGVGLAIAFVEYRPQMRGAVTPAATGRADAPKETHVEPVTPAEVAVPVMTEVEADIEDDDVFDVQDDEYDDEYQEYDDDDVDLGDWDIDEWADADWDEDDEFGFDVTEMVNELKDDPDFAETLEEMRNHPDPKIRELAEKMALELGQ